MKDDGFRPVTVQTLDVSVLNAFERLVALLDEPSLIAAIAPLITEEIVVRLLNGPHGPQLLHIFSVGSPEPTYREGGGLALAQFQSDSAHG